MQVPSGRRLSREDTKLLRLMAEYGFVRHSETPFKLKSGVMSHVYVFGRDDLTDNPELEYAVGLRIADTIVDEIDTTGDTRKSVLIGLPTAGTPLAQAAAMVQRFRQMNTMRDLPVIAHRIMREKLKGDHGVHNTWVNGKPDLGRHLYWAVDNVVTDGGTKVEDAAKLAQDGYPAMEMPSIIFVDRQQGGLKRLTQAGFTKLIVVFNLLDITYAYGELGLWPKEAVKAVEDEIKAHQFE